MNQLTDELLNVLPVESSPAFKLRTYRAGQYIYRFGDFGLTWYVKSGCVRLNRIDPEIGPRLSGIAIQGDVVGIESLLFNTYVFEAVALTDCELIPWIGHNDSNFDVLLNHLLNSQERMADILTMREGVAIKRIERLILLICEKDKINMTITLNELPTLQHMADITALTSETVSRIISQLRRTGYISDDYGKNFTII
jgi:CRP-like cAMP-binding protein